MPIWQEDMGQGKNNEGWACRVDKGPVAQDLRGYAKDSGLFFLVRAMGSYWEVINTGNNMVGG